MSWYKIRYKLKRYKDALNIGYYLRKKHNINFKIKQGEQGWELYANKKI